MRHQCKILTPLSEHILLWLGKFGEFGVFIPFFSRPGSSGGTFSPISLYCKSFLVCSPRCVHSSLPGFICLVVFVRCELLRYTPDINPNGPQRCMYDLHYSITEVEETTQAISLLEQN